MPAAVSKSSFIRCAGPVSNQNVRHCEHVTTAAGYRLCGDETLDPEYRMGGCADQLTARPASSGRWGASGPAHVAPARWRSDDTTTGRTAMWTSQDPTRPLFILRLSPFNTQANHSTLAAASPASCRAVGRGGGGHGRSPGRTVGTPAQYSSGLQEPSRSWISNADIPDRGRRQQGFLRGLAGNGPAYFSLMVEASLSMPSSRQGPIAKAAIRAAWSFCANGETHFNLAQDNMDM